jgi:hypothetical protein
VNDEKDVEGTSHQIMRCINCYVNLSNVANMRTKIKKKLSNLWYIYFEETCRCTSFHNCKIIEEKVNN